MKRIGVEDRRARLVRRHHLATGAQVASAVQVARDLVGLHATDPSSVFLSAAARMRAPRVVAIERDLYEQRSLVRMLGMRRTMWVLPHELASIVQAACTRAIAVRERIVLIRILEEAGVADASRWLDRVGNATVKALAKQGDATASQLATAVPDLRTKLRLAQGKAYEATPNATSYVLMRLAADGRIVRGRPTGAWTTNQYSWATLESWLPAGFEDWAVDMAQAELARRWLAAFGPAPISDLRWWTGWNAGEVKRALTEIGPEEVDLEGITGLVLRGDVEPAKRSQPRAALLPGLDPTVMGWLERRWFLGPHAAALFDRTGNAGPTVWWDGRVVGGWAQRKDGEVVFRLLEDIGRDAIAAVTAEAERLYGWIGSARITPRFRTPLERELSS
jgi:winged helix DNA-binding protein